MINTVLQGQNISTEDRTIFFPFIFSWFHSPLHITFSVCDFAIINDKGVDRQGPRLLCKAANLIAFFLQIQQPIPISLQYSFQFLISFLFPFLVYLSNQFLFVVAQMCKNIPILQMPMPMPVQCSLNWVGIIIGKRQTTQPHPTTLCVITFRVYQSSVELSRIFQYNIIQSYLILSIQIYSTLI